MALKRNREDGVEIETINMAKCLILLSQIPHKHTQKPHQDVFECKTCNRKFPSFQALGGHRASHKKPRLMGQSESNQDVTKFLTLATKPKTHECSICGLEFRLGQALGGHMRKHRQVVNESNDNIERGVVGVTKLGMLRRSNSSKRVFGLDLNLTPLENDLEFMFGKMAPKVDSSFIV